MSRIWYRCKLTTARNPAAYPRSNPLSLPDQIAAYDDCFEAFEAAYNSPRGARLSFNTEGAARQFQLRMHNARAIERRESRRMHDKSSPQWDKSQYDRLCVRNPREINGRWWIYIEPYAETIGQIELL